MIDVQFRELKLTFLVGQTILFEPTNRDTSEDSVSYCGFQQRIARESGT